MVAMALSSVGLVLFLLKNRAAPGVPEFVLVLGLGLLLLGLVWVVPYLLARRERSRPWPSALRLRRG